MLNSEDNVARLLSFLHEREIEKIRKFALACGEEFNENFIEIVLKNIIKVIPNSIKDAHLVPVHIQESIDSIERAENYVLIKLKDGRVLKSFPSRQQYRNYYYCFRHKLPKFFTPESYQACYDILFRYHRGDRNIRDMIRVGLFRPSGSSSIIECGAYNGWKALGYAKHVGKKGKIVVLEIDKDQYELAKFNLENNLKSNQYIIMHTGVWNSVETKQYSYEHYGSHTLKTPDEHRHHTQKRTTATNTLDNIIDGTEVDIFDFINIQTGGSELESVQGLVRNLNKVKVMWLGTHYSHEGISSRYKSIDYLLQQGCRVYGTRPSREITTREDISEFDVGGFWAVTPAFKDVIVPKFNT